VSMHLVKAMQFLHKYKCTTKCSHLIYRHTPHTTPHHTLTHAISSHTISDFSHFPKNNDRNITTMKCVPNFAGRKVHGCFVSFVVLVDAHFGVCVCTYTHTHTYSHSVHILNSDLYQIRYILHSWGMSVM